MTQFELHQGDCLEVMKTLPDNSVDSIVTDPPYGIGASAGGLERDVLGVIDNVRVVSSTTVHAIGARSSVDGVITP